MAILEKLTSSLLFWTAWLVIPLIVDTVSPVAGALALLKRRIQRRWARKPELYPEISVIIPVCNAADTLEECIRSVYDGDYPVDQIQLLLVNDHSADGSFEVFARCQKEYLDLRMQWLNAGQGKSRMPELALRYSAGKYIIHIDSGGVLEPSALRHTVEKLEAHPAVNCMTGILLTRRDSMEPRRGLLRTVQRLEYLEYARALLTGRGCAAGGNDGPAIFAFRKTAVPKSRTSGAGAAPEDVPAAFWMRDLARERVRVSRDSILFVAPVERVEKLYTQRQRRQRGSLEAARVSIANSLNSRKLFRDNNVRALVYDRTVSFPRMMWYLALLALVFVGGSSRMVLWAAAWLIGCYTVCGYLGFFAVRGYLRELPEVREYYSRQWLLVPLLPVFDLAVLFIRLAGMVNSVSTAPAWKIRTLAQERAALRAVVERDMDKLGQRLERLRRRFNGDAQTMYRPRTLEEKARGSVGYYLWVGLGGVAAMAVIVVCVWGSRNYTAGLDAIINTFFGPMDGVGNGILQDGLRSCLPPVIAFTLFAAAVLWLDRRRSRKAMREPDGICRSEQQRRVVALRRATSTATALLLAASVAVAQQCYGVVDYAITQLRPGGMDIYEEYYVKPDLDAITARGKPRNLIYIYMESMETSYASRDVGGSHEVNYIPNLTRLARDNVSFSNTGKLGGFYSNFRSTWTMAAMLTTTSGVPYDLTVTDAQLAGEERYGPGLVSLGDLLQAKGYHNEFICGSDAQFGGRAPYLVSHGDYEIVDLYTAQERGFLAEGYTDGWWGFEDYQLYSIARQEARRLWEAGQPFNLTLLTVDTHTPNGHVCKLCGDDYELDAANVTLCADQQVAEFVDWCRAQPFFEDTLIVITGDHPTMGSDLVSDQDWNDRRVYNCLINPVWDGTAALHNREFMAFDVFPTVVSAMGFSIPGDRLGLGVDLFSGQRTLAERVGIQNIQDRLEGRSDYYDQAFARASE